jgi:membrane protein
MRSSQSSDLPESAKGSHRSLISLLRLAWVDYERDRGRYLAAAMVYYAMLSAVPLCLLLLATLGLLLRVSSIAAAMQEQMLLRIEASFGSHLREIISQLLNTLKRGSLVASAISLVGLVLTASVLFHHLRMTFRAIWKHQPPLVSGPVRVVVRQTVLEKLISFAMVLSAGILLFVVLVLVSVTQWINRLLGSLSLPSGTGWLLTATSLVIAAITFALLLKFLPPVPLRWRDIWFAVLLCSVAWVVTTELLALYAAFFGSSHSAYGVVGGILAVMVLMNTVSQMLFYGAELCKIMATGKRVVH